MNHTKAGRAKSRREFYEAAWLDAFMRTLDPRPCGGCDYCRGVRAVQDFAERVGPACLASIFTTESP